MLKDLIHFRTIICITDYVNYKLAYKLYQPAESNHRRQRCPILFGQNQSKNSHCVHIVCVKTSIRIVKLKTPKKVIVYYSSDELFFVT